MIVVYHYAKEGVDTQWHTGEIDVDDEIDLDTGPGWAMLRTALLRKHPGHIIGQIMYTVRPATPPLPKNGHYGIF